MEDQHSSDMPLDHLPNDAVPEPPPAQRWAGSIAGHRFTARRISRSLFVVYPRRADEFPMTAQQLACLHTASAIDRLCGTLLAHLDVGPAGRANDAFVRRLLGHRLSSTSPSTDEFWDRNLYAHGLRYRLLERILESAPAPGVNADALIDQVGGVCLATRFAMYGLILVSSGQGWPLLPGETPGGEVLERLSDLVEDPPPIPDHPPIDRGYLLHRRGEGPREADAGGWHAADVHGVVVRAEPLPLWRPGQVQINLSVRRLAASLTGWQLFRLMRALTRLQGRAAHLEVATALDDLELQEPAATNVALSRLEQLFKR